MEKVKFDKDNDEISNIESLEKLNDPLNLKDVLVKCNVSSKVEQDKLIEEIVRLANNNKKPSATRSMFGKLIDPGKIGVIDHNGTIELIGPGRYRFFNPRSSLVEVLSLENDHLKYETLTIIRVKKGQIGLAHENGNPILLGEGIHVRNDRLFQFDSFQALNQQYIKHNTFHIIRVPKGYFGLVTENNIPKLLEEGVYVVNSSQFSFDGLKIINQPYIQHGTIHILRVSKGMVALISHNNKPKLLEEGTHIINSKTFYYTDMKSLTERIIKHETITRFIVRKGEIGLAWDENQPVFFDEGIYYKDSPNFNFEKCVSASEKQIIFGAKKIITVYDGEVGVSYNRGKLVILKPSRHVLESSEHLFQGFLSMQQQCLHLFHPTKDNDEILKCETKDFVEIGLKADVFYRLIDPEKVLMVVGKDNIDNLIRETAIATLNTIIRSTSLSEVAQNKEVKARSQNESQNSPLFFDKVHDEFISKLHDQFSEKFGIAILNIRIESFKIMSQELANNISKQAFTTAQTQTKLANLTSQTEIATAQQMRDAEVARIKAEGQAIALKTKTDAQNRAISETAKTNAEATVIRARADAQAIEVKAQAEAKSILVKSEAESKRSELLTKVPLGGQLAQFEVYTEMVSSSMKGIDKVLYLPVDGTNSPLSFLNTQGMLGNIFPFGDKKKSIP
jgi:regulator of protease activity HflC (stomatin/prohibitin superfamily)